MRTSTRVFFKKLQKDDKKSVIQLELKGNINDKQMIALMNMAGSIVDVDFITPQADIDDFEHDDETGADEHQGIKYTVNNDGSVDADPNQVTLDDIEAAQAEVAQANQEAAASVDEVAKKRTRKNKEKEVLDGEPSEDEKEIMSMESEVSQEERAAEELTDDLPF
jgi:hypothetical protein